MGKGCGAIHVASVDADTMNDRLLKIGIIGTVIAALCCFTPILVVLLSAIGLSAVIGVLDFILLPALAIFIAITGYALWKRRTAASN